MKDKNRTTLQILIILQTTLLTDVTSVTAYAFRTHYWLSTVVNLAPQYH